MFSFQRKEALVGLVFVFTLFVVSCSHPRKFRYFQTEDNVRLVVDSIAYTLPKVQPNDVISVEVFALDPDVVRPFNQEGLSSTLSVAATQGMPSAPTQSSKGYLVDIDGFIDFPVLGKINVMGQNRIQVADVIRERLRPYVNNPRVNVTIANHKVTVLGAVRTPGVFPITSDRLTLDELIAMAGDLNETALGSNIRVIRELNGKKIEYNADILSANFFRSPVYFLQNNDLVYVELRTRSANANSQGQMIFAQATQVIFTISNLIWVYVRLTRF